MLKCVLILVVEKNYGYQSLLLTNTIIRKKICKKKETNRQADGKKGKQIEIMTEYDHNDSAVMNVGIFRSCECDLCGTCWRGGGAWSGGGGNTATPSPVRLLRSTRPATHLSGHSSLPKQLLRYLFLCC